MKLQLVALFLAAVQDNEAEKLFRAMEARMAAKSIQLTIEASIEVKNTKAVVKGTFLQEQGRKMRFDVLGADQEKVFRHIVVSNGDRLLIVGPNGKHELKTPTHLDDLGHFFLNRLGLFFGFSLLDGPGRSIVKEPKLHDKVAVGNFRLGKSEILNGQEAQIVEYDLALDPNAKEKLSVKCWIDRQTKLLVKRIIKNPGEGPFAAFELTEDLTNTKLDEKIDDKKFDIGAVIPPPSLTLSEADADREISIKKGDVIRITLKGDDETRRFWGLRQPTKNVEFLMDSKTGTTFELVFRVLDAGPLVLEFAEFLDGKTVTKKTYKVSFTVR